MTKKLESKKTNKLNYTNHIANTVGADASVRPQTHRGITLIALVITIIVMLILVAVTVTIAINGGLFGMAKDAKADTEKELAKENALSTGRVKIDGTWYDSMEDYVNGNKSENQSDDSAGGESTMPSYDTASKTGKGDTLTENALWTEENGKTAVIPKGFKVVAGKDGEEDKSIENGLVIEDAEGNQFVWIPVTYEATGEQDEHGLDQGFLDVFYRSDWSDNKRGKKYDADCSYKEQGDNVWGQEDPDYYAMMLSVQKNKGFYIGRYEAGSTTPRTNASAGDTTMVVKRDQYPYNYVRETSFYRYESSEESGFEAGYLSYRMYKDKSVGVVSTLCYGIQWDAMLDFIKDGTHNVTSSTTWGNYESNAYTITRTQAKYSEDNGVTWQDISDEGKTKDSSTSILLTTGASDDFVAKNIYDVAGNLGEWTMEQYWNDEYLTTLKRGGEADYMDGSGASSRGHYNTPGEFSYMDSFRPALYIKN